MEGDVETIEQRVLVTDEADVASLLLSISMTVDVRAKDALITALNHSDVRKALSEAAYNGETSWTFPAQVLPDYCRNAFLKPFLYRGLYVYRKPSVYVGETHNYTVCWNGETPGGPVDV